MHRPRLVRVLAAAWFLLACAASVPAQSPSYARDPKQPIDAAYTAKIKEYTTAPFFSSPLVDYLPASKAVPTPGRSRNQRNRKSYWSRSQKRRSLRTL